MLHSEGASRARERLGCRSRGRRDKGWVGFRWPLIGRNRPDVIGKLGNIDPFGQLKFAN